jgi:hypothetical protein
MSNTFHNVSMHVRIMLMMQGQVASGHLLLCGVDIQHASSYVEAVVC